MEKVNTKLLRNIWVQMQSFSCRNIKTASLNNIFNLLDIFIFLVFLLSGTIVLLSMRDKTMFQYANTIQKQFIDRPVYNGYGYEMTYIDLRTVDDWWFFIETTFIESISQFGNQNEDESVENHVLLCAPRLRHIRVANSTCSIHTAFQNQFQTCYGEYVKLHEEREKFSNKTKSAANFNIHSVWGQISTYCGNGYIERLSSIPKENEATLEKLKLLNWIDRGTRLISIEFVTYNANINLLCNIKFIVEFATSGGILTSSIIQPLKSSILCEGFCECICSLLFFTITFFYSVELLLKAKIMGCFTVLNSFWTMADIIVTLLAHLSLFYIAWHTNYLKEVFDYKDQRSEVIISSIDDICCWNMYFHTGMGVCLFIAWIKILKYIQLNKTILQFSSTIKKCANILSGFVVLFVIVFVAFADLSVLLFGTNHADFCDFTTAMITMMRIVLGDLYYSEMEEARPILGPIYFLSYILFVFFILLNMFLAIISDTFSAVKSGRD